MPSLMEKITLILYEFFQFISRGIQEIFFCYYTDAKSKPRNNSRSRYATGTGLGLS